MKNRKKYIKEEKIPDARSVQKNAWLKKYDQIDQYIGVSQNSET